MPLSDVKTSVEGDFDPRGTEDDAVGAHMQALRVHFDASGVDADQMKQLIEQYTQRCPMYTTLVRAAPIMITVGDQPKAIKSTGLKAVKATAEPTGQMGQAVVSTGGQRFVSGMNTAPNPRTGQARAVKVSAKSTHEFGRALVTTSGKEFIIDSVPPLKGPNINRNPLDVMLGSLASCSLFVSEKVAGEHGITISGAVIKAESDLDPRGLTGMPVNPRIRALRLHMILPGVGESLADEMIEKVQNRCPVYATLSLSAPITISKEL